MRLGNSLGRCAHAYVVAVFFMVGCGDPVDPPAGDAGDAGGPVGDGGDGGPPSDGGCRTRADCTAPSECSIAECTAGACVAVPLTAGTPATTQTAGDCQRRRCDGAGGIMDAADDTDVPDDSNPCTDDACATGTPAHTPVAAGTACGTDLLCDAAGMCVGCVMPSDCPGTDDECGMRTCTAGVCDMAFTAVGTPVAVQTAGDCQVTQCDGSGATVSVADDGDLPDDSNDCTDDTCTVGAPTNPPRAAGVSCGTGATVCDGAGACVGCAAPTDCAGVDTDCQTRTCTAGTCGFDYVASGTPMATQTAGDCQRNDCDGSGGSAAVSDDTDLPADDGNACTAERCATGVPSHPPVPVFSTCTAGACDGAGTCGALVDSGQFWVARAGVGTLPLSNGSTEVFIERHGTDGSLLGTIALPTAAGAWGQPFAISGSASSEGLMSRSENAAYVVLAGYAAAPGMAGVGSTASAVVNRVVARVDAAGTIDTSTLLDVAFSMNNVRSATSADGTSFWVGGSGVMGGGGVHHVTLGSTGASTPILPLPASVRQVHIVGGQLYATCNTAPNSAVFAIGTGLPTTTPQTGTTLNGMPTATGPSPFSFVFLDMDAAVAGPDTAYVADDRSVATGGGLQRWAFDGTIWTLELTFAGAGGATTYRGLTGMRLGNRAILYATTSQASPNRLVRLEDDGVGTPIETVMLTAATNTVYRGVTLAPR